MRVYGEAFLFINGWMDFLCLLLAARFGRSRFRAGKALVSAGVGGMYGVLARMPELAALRSVPMLLLMGGLIAWIAFGRRGPRLFPLVLLSGWLLSGLSDFALANGAKPASVIWIDGGAAVVLCLSAREMETAAGGHYGLRIVYEGKTALLPALRDTGNLLTDSATGLPVIIVPEKQARPLLPAGTNPRDLATLPPGWRLVRAKTAAGSRALMCFEPDLIEIKAGKYARHTEAVIAVSDFEESRALLPGSIFIAQREEMCHAVL